MAESTRAERAPLIAAESSGIERIRPQSAAESESEKKHNCRSVLCRGALVLVAGAVALYALWSSSYYAEYADMTSAPPCAVHHSFQDSAREVIPAIFSSFSADNRLSLAALYAKLGIYSFAYFPLQSGQTITYATWDFDKRKLGEVAPPPTTWVTTNDPVEVVLYYANSLHVVQGDLEDARTGTNDLKIANIASLADKLREGMVDILSSNISASLSWDRYMSYPGPFNRVWPDGTVVTWAISATSLQSRSQHDPSRLLFLPVTAQNKINTQYNLNRRIDNQLWGSNYPRDGDSVGEAFGRLMQSQVANTKKRYKKLLKLDPTGKKKHWAAKKVLLQPDNIVTFHKVRKILRTVAVTIETFPDMIAAFYHPVPAQVIAFVNENFGENLDPSLPLYYGDVFCYSGLYRFGSASTNVATAGSEHNLVQCTDPIYSISALLFIADKHNKVLSPSFFGLSKTDLNSIRGVMLLQGSKLGQHVSVSNSIGCPARHDSFKQMKNGSPTNLYDSAVDGWHTPLLKRDYEGAGGGEGKYVINGTICEFDHYFGHVHDLLIRIEQNSPVVNASYEEYTILTAQGLEAFARDSNINNVVDDILAGLC